MTHLLLAKYLLIHWCIGHTHTHTHTHTHIYLFWRSKSLSTLILHKEEMRLLMAIASSTRVVSRAIQAQPKAKFLGLNKFGNGLLGFKKICVGLDLNL